MRTVFTLLTAASHLFALDIVRPGVHQIEDGAFAGADSPFVAGETVYFSAQLGGYKANKKRVSIEYKVEALDRLGTPLVEPVTGKVDVELHDEDKDWKPKIRQQVLIPPHAAGGAYLIRVFATDLVAKSSAVKEIEFHVRGPKIEPDAEVTVRNLQFFRSEEDAQPMTAAIYRPGETLWARFLITGFSLGAGNAVDVDYTVSVSTSEGKVLFTQPAPTSEQGSSYYPKRFFPCTINLSLQPNIATGQYSVTITARDKMAGKTSQATARFSVEK